MKHEAEIDNILKELLQESWMTDEEYEEMLSNVLGVLNITKQKMSDNIETGIKNGYSVDRQIQILKRAWEILF